MTAPWDRPDSITSLVSAGRVPKRRPERRTDGVIYRNLGQIYWRIRHEWLREDDYMSLPVLRLRCQSCLGRPEVAGAAMKGAVLDSAVLNNQGLPGTVLAQRHGERCSKTLGKEGAMLCGFSSRGPEAVLETPVRARCEGCA